MSSPWTNRVKTVGWKVRFDGPFRQKCSKIHHKLQGCSNIGRIIGERDGQDSDMIMKQRNESR